MIKLFQNLPGDTKYFGLFLIKSMNLQSYSNGHQRNIFTSVCYEIPNFCVPMWFHNLENALQLISDGPWRNAMPPITLVYNSTDSLEYLILRSWRWPLNFHVIS